MDQDPNAIGLALGLDLAKLPFVSGLTLMITDELKTRFGWRGQQTRNAKSVVALACSLVAYYPGHLPTGWPLAKIVGAALVCAFFASRTARKRRERPNDPATGDTKEKGE